MIIRVLLSLAVCAAGFSFASTVLERNAAQRVAAADQIVVGSVSGVSVSERADTIWTDVTITVDQALRGTTEDRVVLAFWGGQLDDGRFLRVDGMPSFAEGDRVLLFLDAEEGRASATIGLWQGAFKVTQRGFENARGETLVVDTDGVLTIGREAGDAAAVVRALEDLRDAEPDGSTSDEDSDAVRVDDTEAVSEDMSPEAPAAGSEEADDADASAEVAPAFTLAFNSGSVPAAAADAAQQIWQTAGVDVAVTITDEAPNAIEVGPAERFGSGIISLSLRGSDDEGSRVLLNPGRRDMQDKAVAAELAFLAGVQPQVTGWLSGALPSDEQAQPNSADAAALRAALGRIPEDVNDDGVVDFYDLVQVASSVGESGPGLLEDLDASGTVDQEDIDLLKARYEFTPASPDGPP